MKRAMRWVSIVVGALVGLVAVAAIVVYVASERILRRTYPLPAVVVTLPTDAASIDEGRRIAVTRGCMGSCHGREMQGRALLDDPMLGRIVAPDITTAAQRYSAEELALILRHGLRPDGHTMMVMPSKTYSGLDDADLGRLIAFLKSQPPIAGPGPEVALGPVGRIGLVAGKFKTSAEEIAELAELPPAANDVAAHGRYLARSICTECHGSALRGDENPEFRSPPLRVVAAYTPDAFARLLKTGIAPGDRTVGVMTSASKTNLSQLTDDEIAALYAYLHALPAP